MEASFTVLGTPKRVVLASVDNQNNGSPISPMANLKLLTKVATSYIDENASDPPCRIKKTPVKNQRQLRSLGFICKKFLDLYNLNIPSGHSKQISLGHLTILLDIEKRRVYDIINIIASLRYASKVCKDKYSWYGNQYLIPTLCELKTLALSRNYHLLLQKCLNNNVLVENNLYGHSPLAGDISLDSLPENDESQFFDDNRIGALCQKSMMLFLIAPKGEPLNFKIISHIILPKDVQDKTGMRRLYDISNVLEALGLIKRCNSKHMKRPTFTYSGPQLPPDNSNFQPVAGSILSEIEHLSDTSSDSCESKIPNLFDFVSNELEKAQSKSIDLHPSSVTAKKQLFPEINSNSNNSGFIKAPQSSFKFTANGLVKIVSQEKKISECGKLETKPILAPAFPQWNRGSKTPYLNSVDRIEDKSQSVILRVNKIAQPITVYKISNVQNAIQNGGIYKVVKQGNILNFVPLKTNH